VTGISPQETLPEGFTESEACKYLMDEVFVEDTIAVGFNNVRFDNEFLRYMFFRNYYDAYEWSWRDGRETWDILDLVRMVRALRPEGIEWPVSEDGRATNRLELITKLNGIGHEKAHDALSDVHATIAVAKLLKEKQPKLFEWLMSVRDKKSVMDLVGKMEPFVYVSGRYDEKFNKATVALPISINAREAIVWDLRVDPKKFIDMSNDELRDLIFIWSNEETKEKYKNGEIEKVPIKSLKFNKCPAIAPIGVLEKEDGWRKIELSKKVIEKNRETLKENDVFIKRIIEIFEDKPEYKKDKEPLPEIAEEKLYDGFAGDGDKKNMMVVRSADKSLASKWASDLSEAPKFSCVRLNDILPRYLARNFYEKLPKRAQDEYDVWRKPRIEFAQKAFEKDLFDAITKNADEQDAKKQKHDAFVLENLRLWLEDILN